MLDLKERFDTASEPPHRDIATRITAGRRQLRRQRTAVVVGSAALVGLIGAGATVLPGIGGGSDSTAVLEGPDETLMSPQDGDLVLVVGDGLEIDPSVRIVDEDYDFEGGVDSSTLMALELPDGTRLYVANYDGQNGETVTSEVALDDKQWPDMWTWYDELPDSVLHKPEPPDDTQPGSMKLQGRTIVAVPGSGFEVVDQRQVEFGERAGDGKEIIAMLRGDQGQTPFVVVRFVDGDQPDWFVQEDADFADLDAFEAWARERYDSNEGVR